MGNATHFEPCNNKSQPPVACVIFGGIVAVNEIEKYVVHSTKETLESVYPEFNHRCSCQYN